MNTLTVLCLACYASLIAASSLGKFDETNLIDLLERLGESKADMVSSYEHEKQVMNHSDSPLLNLRQHCNTKGSFSGMEYAFMGYNAFYGYPLAIGRDPGFDLPIFLANFDPNMYTSDCRYMVPNGYQYYEDVACEISFKSDEVKTKEDFDESLGVSANIEGSGWGASFSASTDYQNAVQEITDSNAIYIVSSASCQYASVRLKETSPPPLEPNFLAAVKDLAGTDDREKYYAFFKTYGTHYVSDMTFGARLTYQHKMTQEGYRKARRSSLSVSVQASYEGIFSIGGGVGVDSSTKSAVESFQQNVETTTVTVGAQPSASGGATEWASTIKNTPMPMKYNLKSIDKIFTTAFFPPSNLSNSNREKVKRNIITYSNNYLQSLVDSGEASVIPQTVIPDTDRQTFDVIFFVSDMVDGYTWDKVAAELFGDNGKNCVKLIDLYNPGAWIYTYECQNLGTVTSLQLSKLPYDGVMITFIIVTERLTGISYYFDMGWWLNNDDSWPTFAVLEVSRMFGKSLIRLPDLPYGYFDHLPIHSDEEEDNDDD